MSNTKKIWYFIITVCVFLVSQRELYAAEHNTTSSGIFGFPIEDTSVIITCGYGDYDGHTGYDLGATYGTPIYALFSGTITYRVYYHNGVSWSYGNLLELQSDDGTYVMRVAHLSAFVDGYPLPSGITYSHANYAGERSYSVATPDVITVGSSHHVNMGDLIGYSGYCGNSTGDHLHVEIKVNGNYVDPDDYISNSYSVANSSPVSDNRTHPYVFDVAYYKENNPDLSNMSDSEARSHWLNWGISEGRVSSPVFNLGYYLEKNEDLKNAYQNDHLGAIAHFLNFGISEGRRTHPTFYVQEYKANYKDLQDAYRDDYSGYFNHYMYIGRNEGRIADHRLQLYFDANGGTSSRTQQNMTIGVAVGTLPSLTLTGYTGKWYTAKTGGTEVTSSYVPSGLKDVYIYAHWTPLTYTISYNANGGTGAPSNQTVKHGESLTLSSGIPVKGKYTFLGWATSPDGVASYQPGGTMKGSQTLTLYAVWGDTESPVITSASITNVSANKATYTITATDNIGVADAVVHVWTGTWTSEKDKGYHMVQNGNVWSYDIPVNLTDGEEWIVDVRVYDGDGHQA